MLKRNIEKENEVPKLIESIYIQSDETVDEKFKQALEIIIDACDSDESNEINDEHNNINSANEFFKQVALSNLSLPSSGNSLSDFLWDLRSVINSKDYTPIPEPAIERSKMFMDVIRDYKNRHNKPNNSDNTSSGGFNFGWIRIVIGIYIVIATISYWAMDDMDDFMKKVASEYDAPLSEVQYELFGTINYEFKWFPLPHTIWYVTKENGQDVEVGKSSTFGGTEIYKDKLDRFYYLEFWSGSKSLDEMKMDVIKEKMGR